MDAVNIPVESAFEPNEEARQPRVDKEGCHNSTETIVPSTQNITTYKNVLSQPPKGITHKQKLLWLQKRRTEGLWVQCEDCDRWRYLPGVLDRHELPAKWYCWMNPDTSLATCLAPEVPICFYDEDDLIHAEYAAGSVVLARMPGYPWWPAMVCDCPDTEQYYWLDGFSDIPTHYNVVFFDAFDVSRAWIAPEQLLPYKNNAKLLNKSSKSRKYKNRIEVAITQANDAEKLPLSSRLAKYSFIARFNGKILTPKKIKRQEIVRYRNILKRKFNIVDFSDESSSSEEDKEKRNTIIKKSQKIKKSVTKNKPNAQATDNELLTTNRAEHLNTPKDLSSLTVQVDSDSALIKGAVSEASNNNTEREINTITESIVSQSWASQDASATGLTFAEDSENSDNFDY